MTEEVKLNELSKDEWRDVVRLVVPHWTEEMFESAWAEFHDMKEKKKLQ